MIIKNKELILKIINSASKMSKKTSAKQLKLDNMLSASSSPSRSRSPSMEIERTVSRKIAPSSRSESETEQNANKKQPKPLAPIFKSEPAKTEPSSSSSSLIEEIKQKRHKLFESINEFRFNKKRVRVLSEASEFPDYSKGILYWMSRDQRVQDNWALLYAQKLALKQNQPLYVCFSLVPTFLGATLRHYYFMLEGLKEVEQELNELNIGFVLLIGQAKDQVPLFVRNNKIGGVICDFCPLRLPVSWVNEVKKNLPPEVPFAQVDAHNIVPCWHASDKLEYAARTIRNKINSKLDDFLTEFPPVIKHPHNLDKDLVKPVDWTACYDSLKVDRNVKIVDWAQPGYSGGIKTLEDFIKNRLRVYDEDRNDPNKNALSNLSPWYHFGQIAVQRCIMEIKKYNSKCSKSVQAYMEESIVRRELSENYCFYNSNYDKIDGANDWAKITLNEHVKDKRTHLYTLEDFDNFRTHDKLWNAAQIQMRVEGKLHGFMRMYWAKKILEWTESPQQALEFAIYLNDRYNLDGRDCNGYVGCMWSICGTHDQGWAERAVFGKIRYMNYDGCKRKFDVERYINKYYGKKNLV